jgi:glycosyltransferase involved in cell wall biosynthesis
VRIVMTVPSLGKEFGGPVGKARDLASALRGLGHDVILIGAGSSDGSRTIGLGRRASFHSTPVPARVRPLRVAVRGADLVHVIGYRDPVGTIAALEASRRGLPYVLEPVGMFRPRLRSFLLKRGFGAAVGRSLIARADRLIVASSVEADDLLRAGTPLDRVTIRPNGVDFQALLPLPARGPLRERLGIPADVPLIVTLARIGAIKGLPTVARSLGSLKGVWWLLAGPDEHDGTLEDVRAVLADVGAADRAVLHAAGLWGEDKGAALAEADVFCLPSDYESFGTAAAEAGGVGVPVVVTSGCGVRDALRLPSVRAPSPGDAEGLRRALHDALTDPTEPGRSAAAAPAIRTSLDWPTLAAHQITVYESALRDRVQRSAVHQDRARRWS